MINTFQYKLQNKLTDEPSISNEEIPEVIIKQKTKIELIESKHLEILNSSEELKNIWLLALFTRFSSGLIEKGGEQ